MIEEMAGDGILQVAEGFEIEADIASVVNYASWQNSVPVVSSVRVRNNLAEARRRLVLELTFSPAFARSVRWTLDLVGANEVFALSNPDLEIDADYLNALDEAEKAVALFSLKDGEGAVLAEVRKELRLLARDEWGGFDGMGGLAAAFVMPNDPAIAPILKKASDVLQRFGHSPALNGYQSRDPARAYMLAAAIWSSVAGLGLTYAEPPKSFELYGQKVRRPTTIREQGLATCFDTTLLFASALEAVGLNPVVLLKTGHSYCGVWLTEKTLPSLVERDPIEIRKALAARELIVFETTGVTSRPADPFEQAIVIGQGHTNEKNAADFVGAIDIARSRASQIRPMAAHQAMVQTGKEGEASIEAAEIPLPKAPSFEDLSGLIIEEKPSTAQDRIARWQNKLLDLSLRNRLLNFKATKQTVPFLCPNVPALEDLLADQNRIRVISLPEENPHGERSDSLFQEQTGRDLDYEFVVRSLERREIAATLEKSELDKRLTELYRRARSDMTEGGSNTLFLAVGFLRWKKTASDDRTYKAPLLLIPVKLTRRSANAPFYLEHHEDDVKFNSTLLEFLKKDFSLAMPAFDESLPKDESGIDVPLVFETIRRVVRDVPGFEVLDDIALSTFSFAKFLMWKDLVDRTDELRKNRVVRHLIDNPDKAFDPGLTTDFPQVFELDSKYRPADIVTPLPADSSQLSAVMGAAEGRDFVLVGPPGTGKSQTITNMIAQCLATGKSVLFVAEKTAALGVVYRRLKEHGLGDFCLELHSNRAEKKQFLSQLQTSWETKTDANLNEWVTINDQLQVRRDSLNDYVSALHRRATCGLSVFEALGLSVKYADQYTPPLDWDPSAEVGEQTLLQMKETIRDIASVHRQVMPVPALELVGTTEWSNRWVGGLRQAAQSLAVSTDVLLARVVDFARLAGLDAQRQFSLSELEHVVWLGKLVDSTAEKTLAVVFEEQLDRIRQSVEELAGCVETFKTEHARLSAVYEEASIARMPIDQIDQDWRMACSQMWPFSIFAKSRVRKFLQSYALTGKANPAEEVVPLQKMQSALKAISSQSERQYYPAWNGTETDTGHLKAYFDLAGKIRAGFESIGYLGHEALTSNGAMQSCLSGGSATHPLRLLARDLIDAWDDFSARLAAFRNVANTDEDQLEGAAILPRLHDMLGALEQNAGQLQVWTEWQKVKAKAKAQKLSCFLEAVEEHRISHDDLALSFSVAFANWWLPDAIDRSDVLRSFKRFRHEEMLEQFRLLDDEARRAAASKVRSALNHHLPAPHEVAQRSELGLLRYQMELKRPSKSIRDMIASMPTTFNKLAPCLLMSPLSIAQYLPAGQALFDVVIFDEASQITTWDAVGAIARGRQTIIVGDPKQLPPTNFFGRNDGDDDEELEVYEKDLESILDEAIASGLPSKQLNWHYRSRSESLIAFSNWHYYGNRLITFPSPAVNDQAVKLVHVADAVYDRGKSRTNRDEAREIVRIAVAKMQSWLQLAEEDRPTLGVITFNQQQQSLIQDLFDAELRSNQDLEWFFSDDRIEPAIVRNLENVQGDERDVMLFSITFGPDQAGKMSMSFGAINKDGGERRLNVAVTRARAELLVVSTITADVIDTSRTRALGVQHLKEFLAYAEKGSASLPAAISGSEGGFDSPFEEAVSDALQARGWTVIPQVGVSGFRIDLGIVHPDRPGAFLAGIECDGATYHRSATARDRDKVREQVLRNLGWEILRIWSPDWWYDASRVAGEIHQKLDGLVVASREEEKRKKAEARSDGVFPEADAGVAVQPVAAEAADSAEASLLPMEPSLRDHLPEEPVAAPANQNEPFQAVRIAQGPAMASETLYTITDLQSFAVDPDRFYDVAYSSKLASMIDKIVETEGPIKDTLLAQRVTKAHGWSRTGNRLREHIFAHLKSYDFSEGTAGRFVWKSGARKELVPFRKSLDRDNRRPVNDISLAEIAGLIREKPGLLQQDEPVYAIAHEMGYDRVASAIQARLCEAIAYYSDLTDEQKGV